MKTPTAHEFLPLRAPEEGRLYLDHLGWHQCPPGWRCGPAARDYYLFHFILDGCGTVARKGAVRRLAAGKSFLLRPGDSVVYCADPETPWSYCYFGLRGQDVPRYLEKTVFSGGRWTAELGDVPLLRTVCQVREQLLDAPVLGFLSEECSLRLLGAYYQPAPEEKNYRTAYRSENAYVHMAKEFIASNFTGPLSVAGLAEQLNLNRCYLSTLFKETVGLSLTDYILSLRLERAQKLLNETRLPLLEIAHRSGFESYSAFFRAFKRKFQVSASGYRKKQNAE